MNSPFDSYPKKKEDSPRDTVYNLEGKVDYDQPNWRGQVARAVTDLTNRLRMAVRGVDELKGAGYLTKAEAAALYSPSVLRHALEVRGSDPLTLLGLLGAAYAPVIVDIYANRPAAGSRAIGDLFWATDRTVLYLVETVGGVNTWVYIAGTTRTTLAGILTGLGTNDAGLLDFITDYSHTLRWSGSAWTWAPGDDGSGYYRLCESAPADFGANAWQIADGTAVDRLNADGTVTNVTTPDLTTAAYLKGGIAAAAIAAASGATANVTATNNAAATGVTVDAAATGVTTQFNTTGISVTTHPSNADAAVTGAATRLTSGTHTVNDPSHNHGITDPTHSHTVTDPTHNHTQNSHKHTGGDLEFRNKQVGTYYRR